MKRLVIAVAGTSGAGKTTVVRAAARRLGDEAVALYFDAYAPVSHYPPDLGQWVRNGADPDAWRTPRLAANLKSLREGIPILLPDEKTRISPAPFILVEEPFGRARGEMAPLIDLAVFLDLPPETALARLLLRNLGTQRFEEQSETALVYVRDYLDRYLNHGLRDLYAAAANRARRSCDILLDGSETVDALTEAVIAAARREP